MIPKFYIYICIYVIFQLFFQIVNSDTPLDLAVRKGKVEIMGLFLENGALESLTNIVSCIAFFILLCYI